MKPQILDLHTLLFLPLCLTACDPFSVFPYCTGYKNKQKSQLVPMVKGKTVAFMHKEIGHPFAYRISFL